MFQKVTALKATALTSVSLAVQALLAMTAQASVGETYSTESAAKPHSDVLSVGTSELEASFIKVSKNCKVSHGAFEAVRVGIETIAPEVRAIHAEIEAA
jgi:hypothetical protein